MAVGETWFQAPSDAANTGKFMRYRGISDGTRDVLSLGTFLTDPNTFGQVQAVTAKGTQGAYAAAVQNLRDSGRVIFSCATVIAGVTAVTTEALLTMVPTRDGVAAGTATTQAVTAGKRLRIVAMTVGCITTGAAVFSARVSLRMNPAGATVASSPILHILNLSAPAAVAQTGDWCGVTFPDGVEMSGTHQFGITQVCSATTGTVWASILAFEY